MIKTGLSARVKDFPRLARLLKSHPDVEIAWITNNGSPARIANIFPELTGDFDGTFIVEPDFEAIDLYIGPYTPRLAAYPDVKAILTDRPNDESFEVECGIPEFCRKALVRGARATVIPGQTELLGALALMPLARNLLLNGAGGGSAVLASDDSRPAAAALGRHVSAEAFDRLSREILSQLQTSFASPFKVLSFTTADDVAMATFTVESRTPLPEVWRMYHQFYDDHRHVVLVEDPASSLKASMVRDTNKAVVSLSADDSTLYITALLDARMKQGAGMAIHLLNLLFGLHELTGF